MSLDATIWAWKQNKKITARDKLVLLSFADRADEVHSCFPSISRLEKDTLLNRKTIKVAIKNLEDSGLIRVERRQGRVNIYHLVGVADRHAVGFCAGQSGADNEQTQPNLGPGEGETTRPNFGPGVQKASPKLTYGEDKTRPKVGPGPEKGRVHSGGEGGPNLGPGTRPNLGPQNLTIEPIKESREPPDQNSTVTNQVNLENNRARKQAIAFAVKNFNTVTTAEMFDRLIPQETNPGFVNHFVRNFIRLKASDAQFVRDAAAQNFFWRCEPINEFKKLVEFTRLARASSKQSNETVI